MEEEVVERQREAAIKLGSSHPSQKASGSPSSDRLRLLLLFPMMHVVPGLVDVATDLHASAFFFARGSFRSGAVTLATVFFPFAGFCLVKVASHSLARRRRNGEEGGPNGLWWRLSREAPAHLPLGQALA